jgi:hypothetical protein
MKLLSRSRFLMARVHVSIISMATWYSTRAHALGIQRLVSRRGGLRGLQAALGIGVAVMGLGQNGLSSYKKRWFFYS